MGHKISKVIIPVAGFGSRFLPFTKAVPKEMLPVINVPLINLIVQEALDSGIKEIILITSKFKQAIKNNFSINYRLKKQLKLNHKMDIYHKLAEQFINVKFTYVYQKEQKGLGHAILCAKSKIKNEPFAVMLGDELIYNEKYPVLKQCIDSFDECGNNILGVKDVLKEDVSKYGIVKLRDAEPNQKRIGVIDVIEKPEIKDAPSTCAILGRYIFKPEIFNYLEKTKPSVGNEIQLTDAIKEMIKDSPFSVCYFEGERYDFGTKLGFLRANIDFALKDKTIKESLVNYLKKL